MNPRQQLNEVELIAEVVLEPQEQFVVCIMPRHRLLQCDRKTDDLDGR